MKKLLYILALGMVCLLSSCHEDDVIFTPIHKLELTPQNYTFGPEGGLLKVTCLNKEVDLLYVHLDDDKMDNIPDHKYEVVNFKIPGEDREIEMSSVDYGYVKLFYPYFDPEPNTKPDHMPWFYVEMEPNTSEHDRTIYIKAHSSGEYMGFGFVTYTQKGLSTN